MKVIISGVAGFIGAHTAAHFLGEDAAVVGFDNLSRRGSKQNLDWLKGLRGSFAFELADLRDEAAMRMLLERHSDAEAILHLGGQVAVTSSVANPRDDFESNALGTLNLLEAARRSCPRAAFLFASTNKVYGEAHGLHVAERNGRYAYIDAERGVSEETPLDFHSPYGCSKGSADQYVRDYARIYGLPTMVFRQSCIYGTRQFGVEDQGWVAWLTIATLLQRPITIYGDGKQVRDLLWIDDLISVYARGIERAAELPGAIYNIGGGAENTLSLLELVALLREEIGGDVPITFADRRPGDQRVFVADIGKAKRELGWQPTVAPTEGVQRLIGWVAQSADLIRSALSLVP